MNEKIKTPAKHFASILFFLLLTLVYFAPAVFESKVIQQTDVVKFQGMYQEPKNYANTPESEEHKVIGWIGSAFSGMPSYAVGSPKIPTNFLTLIERIPRTVGVETGIVLCALISFYILMCVMGVNIWLAIAGAIAFTFASYNIIIIEAGHITKAYVIAFMPLTVAGMVLVFKQKFLLGSALTLLGVALSLKNNHVQITFYLAIFCLLLFLGYFVSQVKERKFTQLGKATAIFIVCILLAILQSAGSLYSNYELGKESIRGQSELTEATTGDTKISTGLDLDYAFAWSYGKAETMTLLIPNFYGGKSGGTLESDSEVYKVMKANRMQVEKDVQAPTYWGDQPFTSGPVYFGAIVCFLFILGMFVIDNKLKWWILAATVFFVFLSWGKNLMWFNELMFHYLPMYNKFRTPSMALVIPSLTFAIIAIWGLSDILNGKIETKKLRKYFYISLGLSGGLCFIFWIIPGLFLNFQSVNDAQYQFPAWYYDALLDDRKSLLQKDAFRSLVYILLAAGLIYWFIVAKKKTRNMATIVAVGIGALILIDLWTVDKRYLNNDTFVSKRQLQPFKQSVADNAILQDKDPSYRVLNLNNPFNESYTSYYHKSIGGYSAAKLRRYQELIDHRLSKEIELLIGGVQQSATMHEIHSALQQSPTLNMLNTRYIIYNPGQPPIYNPYALGNAWFVQDIQIVENADAEIQALNTINPQITAVVDKRFENEIRTKTPVADSTAHIEMLSYEPVKLKYKSTAQTEQLAVFSEIYYAHGWESYIDGKRVPHFRTDWTLRGMYIPAGNHEIEFVFRPHEYITASTIGSYISLLILVYFLAVIGYSGFVYLRKEKTAAK